MVERRNILVLRKFILKYSFIFMLLMCLFHFYPVQCNKTFSFTSRRHTSRGCYDARGRPQRCMPEFSNAAFNVHVEATNTCGIRELTQYCFQTSATGGTKSCERCDSRQVGLAHPPEYLTDLNSNNNETWWQSETMFEGLQYPTAVNLTLHLGKAFEITYVRLKFHTSRPESFVIYKRTSENESWIPYQYYSATCRATYGLPDNLHVSQDEEMRALCTSEFSDISPLTGGNVAFSTLEGRPSAYNFENSPVLQEWVTATDIRISLNRMNTFGDEIFGDPNVLKSYYYAITDFAVGGRCKCNGHASECVVTEEAVDKQRLVCRCEHNTRGRDCDECLPFYNDLPWARATATTANECQPCNCNGKSDKCYFDRELYERTEHGGHCVECSDNTDGPHCERCKINFYGQGGRCIPCNCNQIGSRNLQCNQLGQCQCKPGVDGKTCDHCSDDFYNFSLQGCRPCGCSPAGSLNNKPSCDDVTGTCQCKENVGGQKCDRCKPGFFNLQDDSEFGCITCFCFGHSSLCRSAPGYSRAYIESSFSGGKENWKAQLYSGKEIPLLYNDVLQNIEVDASDSDVVYFTASDHYLGDQKSSYNQFLSFTLSIGNNVLQATVEDIIMEGAGLSISQPIFGQGNPLPNVEKQMYKFRLHEHSVYGWDPQLSALDFIRVLSNLTALRIRGTYSTGGNGFLDNVRLDSAHHFPVGSVATWVETCFCPDGYVGQFCESCGPRFRRDPPDGGEFGHCIPCNCHGHSDYCETETGRCICEHNTAGDNCEVCAVGFYGNALQGTTKDCQPCPCPQGGACVALPDDRVICVECPTGYTGHKCELCIDGYYGDPHGKYGPAKPCKICECNGNIDSNAVGNCNTTSGDCLKCAFNTGGPQCAICLPGFYGDAQAVPKEGCKACNCYPLGTSPDVLDDGVLVCDVDSGQCPCKPHVNGQQCDQCEAGFWNVDSGSGCELCNCDLIGAVSQSCDVKTGQCFCRPGITGKKCDTCLSNYYGFSLEGCKACECDPIGSESPQCDNSGQCKCRPNLEGRGCDQCKENKYNKDAGCIDCPTCFNLVQDAVNKLRTKLNELARILDEIRKNPQVVDDLNFEHRLEAVKQHVDDLLNNAERAAGGDGNLVTQLQELQKEIDDAQKTYEMASDKVAAAVNISEQGILNISYAEEAIERAQEALTNAHQLLETEGLDALENAKEQSDRFSQQSVHMSEIAREARHRANQHQDETGFIKELSEVAMNTSSNAYKMAKNTTSVQEKSRDEIERLQNKFNETDGLLWKTKDLARKSKQEAKQAYDYSLDIYTDVSSVTVPDLEVPKLKDRTQDIIEEVRKVKRNTDELLEDNQELMNEIEDKNDEAEELLAEGIHQQQITDEMLTETNAALAKTKEALASGKKTLEEANNNLDTLKKFDKLVKDRKKEANDVLKKAPVIERMLEEAEKNTEDALSEAEEKTVFARDVAKEAKRTAQQTSDVYI